MSFDKKIDNVNLSYSESSSSLNSYYGEHGYVIVRGLIPETKIEDLLNLYSLQVVPSANKFFRQSTSVYETNQISAHGFVTQSFLDIHAYGKFPKFRDVALDLFFHENMMNALSQITGSSSHNLMQSMLFDQNTTTPPHQDWWYLDSVPNGSLLAAWIAMEDIQEEAGRFYVIPKSHHLVFHEEGLSHSEWAARIKHYFDDNQMNVHAPALKKGDVLFWNSRTVHGALPTKDARFSRKSLTAHYLPSQMAFGNLFTTKEWIQYQEYKGYKFFTNQPEYSLKSMLVSSVKSAIYNKPSLMKLARKFQRSAIADL
jgi:phytanoyl-CoA hydroxylase